VVSQGLASFDDAFWSKFEQYPRNNQARKTVVQDRVGYAKKYAHVLVENDAQDLLALSNEKRKHAMKALAIPYRSMLATIISGKISGNGIS
jgi:hypothetical protein